MNKKISIGIAVIVAIGIVAYFFLPRIISGTQAPQESATLSTGDTQNPSGANTTGTTTNQYPVVTSPTGLQMRDEVVGTGDAAVSGKQVTVNYVGALTNGTVFDASSAHGQPFTFTLGSGAVIKGWDEGVAGMKVGGKRLLAIPPELAYGAQAIQGKDKDGKTVDVIPANSTLIFEVELLSVK